MYPLQNISLSREEQKDLEKIYIHNDSHALRERCHVILMRNRGFALDSIVAALKIDKQVAFLMIKIWYYFGINGLLDDDTGYYYEEILKIEKPISKISLLDRIIRILLVVFNFLSGIVIKIFSFIFKNIIQFWKICFIGAAGLISYLVDLDIKRYLKIEGQNTKNTLSIIKNQSWIWGNNNIVFQIITDSKDSTQKILASSFKDVVKILKDIIEKRMTIETTDYIIASSLAFSDKIQKIKNSERRKTIMWVLVMFTAFYIYYGFAIKGGVLILTFLGLSFSIINVNHFFYKKAKLQNKLKTPILTIIPEKKDTVTTIQFLKKEKLNIEDCFQSCEDNILLTVVNGEKQKRYIEQDTVNHITKPYYVGIGDNTFYFHVIAYKSIKEASFQREFLVRNGYTDTKIVLQKENLTPLYLVAIKGFEIFSITDICEIKQEWEIMSDKYSVYFNKKD